MEEVSPVHEDRHGLLLREVGTPPKVLGLSNDSACFCPLLECSVGVGRPHPRRRVKRPGWDLNPRGPEDQQLAWSDSLRSRGSTPSAPMRSGSVAVPGSATRATTNGCLPRINVVLCNSSADLPVEASETLSMILCAIHSNHMRGCIGSCEIS